MSSCFDRPTARRRAGDTYFVGRRLFEAAEVYAVTAADVERLRPAHHYGKASLDWHGSTAARMELSHLVLSRATQRQPSHELQARFALYVLDRLPDGGFVLDPEQIRRWLRLASDPEDFAPVHPVRQSWAGQLRKVFRGRRLEEHDDLNVSTQ